VKLRLLVWLAALSSACAGASPSALRLAEMPAIDVRRLLHDISTLASDEFAGRAPGSPAEPRTINYLIEQFKNAGAEPGNPDGTWVQQVPLVGITPSSMTSLTIVAPSGVRRFAPQSDVVAFSQRVTDHVAIDASPVVFAGYGVQAPEFDWDDFEGVDVRGKTLLVLVNDPPVLAEDGAGSNLDPEIFGGAAMTYYGRWSYKYEKAAALGAAGVFVIHETGPAGYPFSVVQGFGGERFDLVTPDKNMTRPAVQGWLSLNAATAILRLGGLDFGELKTRARTRGFKAVPIDITASMAFDQTLRSLHSRNVVAKVTGADDVLRDEYVIYTAHWDHLGIGAPVDGDAIYNGARDNASGTALLLELARGFAAIRPAPRRTIVFLATTAEEQGLLGSEYYAAFPLYPLARTLAAINMDAINVWGRTRDLTVVGFGASELDVIAANAAKEQGRVLRPDPEPEKGFYYRSDHFSLAKVGVPALHVDAGIDFVNSSPAQAQAARVQWTEHDYHQPSDEVKTWWDLTGAADDGRVLLAVGYRVANTRRFPEWAEGNEFRAIRERSIAESESSAPR
jgi:Zn-dependent M28 family amino/carboxypeptidase